MLKHFTLVREDLSRKSDIEKLKKEIEKVEGRKSNLQRRLLDDEIDSADYKEMKKDIEKDLLSYKSKLESLNQEMTPYKNNINKEIPMMENLLSFYRKSDGKTKKKILSCIFSEKVVLEKVSVATTPFSKPVQVLINTSKVLEGTKNKKEVENDLLSIMAPLNDESCNYNAMSEYLTIQKLKAQNHLSLIHL